MRSYLSIDTKLSLYFIRGTNTVLAYESKNDFTNNGIVFLHEKWGRKSPSDVVSEIQLGQGTAPFSSDDTSLNNPYPRKESVTSKVDGFVVFFKAIFDNSFNGLSGPLPITEVGLFSTFGTMISRVVLPVPLIKSPDEDLLAVFQHSFVRKSV